LALLEEHVSDDVTIQEQGQGHRDTDRSATSLDNDDVGLNDENTSAGNRVAQPSSQNRRHPPASRDHCIASSVDAKVDINMLNRLMSGTELLELLSDHPYYSPASLAAMSLATLNQKVLADPTPVVDAATVAGRTNLITVGIVFGNTGTRISNTSGNAYCTITVGQLQTGPSMSVFLFGQAYSKFSQTCRPGKVVALLGPRLMPAKETNTASSSTAISFSVNDVRQILLVADARDYGQCQARIRGKDAEGRWANDAKRCKHYVDTRISSYCLQHRKQERIKSDPVKGANTMSEIRSEHDSYNNNRVVGGKETGRILTFPRHKPIQLQGPDVQDPQRPHSAQMMSNFQAMVGRGSAGAPMRQALVPPASTTTNRLLQPTSRPTSVVSQLKQPRPIQTSSLSKNTLLNPEARCSKPPPTMNNPYAKTSGQSKTQIQPTKIISKVPSMRPMNKSPAARSKAGKDWLQEGSTVGKKNATTRRRVNNDSQNFDGSVAVPKPNAFGTKLLGGVPVGTSHISSHRPLVTHPMRPGKSEADIRTKQALVAAKLKAGKAKEPPTSTLIQQRTVGNTLNQRKHVSNVGKSPLDLLGDIDIEKTMARKSRFEDDARAEEMALSRNKVAELVRQEEARESKRAKINPSGGSGQKIKKEFFCKTCNRKTELDPKFCRQSGHTIVVRREVVESKSTDEKRQALSDRKAEDGGLKLGSGLNWDSYRK